MANKNYKIKCKDHKGNIYESKGARARAYGLDVQIVSLRIKNGWSLEKALTTPVKTKRKSKFL